MFATISDINVHLPADKAQISDGQDGDLQIEAYRMIRSRLSSAFPIETIALWIDPTETPEVIRGIAGKIIAAKFYSNLVAEDEADGSEFAQNLFNEAMADLQGIRDGMIDVIGIDGVVIENSDIMETSFYPNNAAGDPFFAVADEWA